MYPPGSARHQRDTFMTMSTWDKAIVETLDSEEIEDTTPDELTSNAMIHDSVSTCKPFNYLGKILQLICHISFMVE